MLLSTKLLSTVYVAYDMSLNFVAETVKISRPVSRWK